MTHSASERPKVLACRPVHLDPDDAFDAAIMRDTFVYDGAAMSPCDNCGCSMWVGPRQQRQLDEPGVVKLCFRCIPLLGPYGDIVNLGNPQPRPPH